MVLIIFVYSHCFLKYEIIHCLSINMTHHCHALLAVISGHHGIDPRPGNLSLCSVLYHLLGVYTMRTADETMMVSFD
jgi:hypothetical protein